MLSLFFYGLNYKMSVATVTILGRFLNTRLIRQQKEENRHWFYVIICCHINDTQF